MRIGLQNWSSEGNGLFVGWEPWEISGDLDTRAIGRVKKHPMFKAVLLALLPQKQKLGNEN